MSDNITCAACGEPGHRYGRNEGMERYDPMACINTLRARLESCPDLTYQTRHVAGQNDDGSLNPDLDYTETRWVTEWRAVTGDTE